MKLLTCYSSSSTISFDPTMCNSKSATAGCLAGILRRILCSRGLPTHPSDQIREANLLVSDKDQELKDKQKVEAATATLSTPGIVARLMGLETMVDIPTGPTRNSLSRSRSMNSVDYLGQCNRMQGMHRRVQSTLSFREAPPFVELENEKFFILSFENMSKSKESKSKDGKENMGVAELKQKRAERREFREYRRQKVSDEKILNENEKISKGESDRFLRHVGNGGKLEEISNSLPQFKISSEKFSQYIKREEVVNGEMQQRRKKKTRGRTEKKIELGCNSEEKSPVSVLDFERKAPGSVADSSMAGSNSRRKLSPELENDQHLALRFDGELMVAQKSKAIENKNFEGSKKKKKQSQEYIDIWSEVCREAKDELVGSNPIQEEMWRQGNCESLSADFESAIFDHLLSELIDQLLVGQGM